MCDSKHSYLNNFPIENFVFEPDEATSVGFSEDLQSVHILLQTNQ